MVGKRVRRLVETYVSSAIIIIALIVDTKAALT